MDRTHQILTTYLLAFSWNYALCWSSCGGVFRWCQDLNSATDPEALLDLLMDLLMEPLA